MLRPPAGPQEATAGQRCGGSLQLHLPLNLVRETDAAERGGGLGGKFFVALELAFRQRLAHRLLDFALGGHAQRLEESADTAVKNVLVHDCSFAATGRGEATASEPPSFPLNCANNSSIGSI